MTIRTLTSRTVCENWCELLESISASQVDVIITAYGKPVAAMIRYEDYVALQDELGRLRAQQSEAYLTMLASEVALAYEWNSLEENEAWADL